MLILTSKWPCSAGFFFFFKVVMLGTTKSCTVLFRKFVCGMKIVGVFKSVRVAWCTTRVMGTCSPFSVV